MNKDQLIAQLNAEEVKLHQEARAIIKASQKRQADFQAADNADGQRHGEIQARLAAIESERAGIESVQEAA